MNISMDFKRDTAETDFLDRVRRFNKRYFNRLTIRFAGKRFFSVIHHQGRKSGKAYQTPVLAVRRGNRFIFPLTYGEKADWYRNLMAAGEGRLEWRGHFYPLQNPKVVSAQEALPAFPNFMHPLLRYIKAYLQVDQAVLTEPAPNQTIRRILVYGAGVLGSLYAGKLHQAGYKVTLLARGQRLAELREKGLVLVEDSSGSEERLTADLTDRLNPEDAYDLVMVVVRKNQLPSVLPSLAENRGTPNVLFLVNNAEGPEALVEALGRGRVILGFPGAGGQRVDGVVRYRLASSIQPTTIGELNGKKTERLSQIVRAFEDAGLPVAMSGNMDAWLKTHVALVSPIANALYLAGGSNYRLARTRDGLVLMVRAVKEGLRVVDALGIPMTPGKYRVLVWMPEPLLVALLEKRLGRPEAELVLARHANAARDEMTTLAEEFRELARQSGVRTPAMDALFCYTDPAYPTVAEGRAEMSLAWGPLIAATGALVSAGLLAGWLVWKRGKDKR